VVRPFGEFFTVYPLISMNIGVCIDPFTALTWSSLPCDYVEANVQVLFKPEAPEAEFEPLAQRLSGLAGRIGAANCFLPGDLKVTGPAVDHARLARYADAAFRRAAVVGARFIVFGSGGARQVPEGWPLADGFEQYVRALEICAPLAAKHGVVLVVEPLNRGECNLVNTVLEGAVAVARVNHPNIRLLVDIFHMLRNDESPDDIVKAGPWIAHAHVAEKADRTAPGVAGDDFRPFFAALKRAGYAGSLSIESKLGAVPETEIVRSVEVLREQLAG
jgi:sugar phosphate isomerase/epimerase